MRASPLLTLLYPEHCEVCISWSLVTELTRVFINTKPTVWPGRPYPLGATWDGEGVNFSIFSEHAHKVELCLFDASGRRVVPGFNDAHVHFVDVERSSSGST